MTRERCGHHPSTLTIMVDVLRFVLHELHDVRTARNPLSRAVTKALASSKKKSQPYLLL